MICALPPQVKFYSPSLVYPPSFFEIFSTPQIGKFQKSSTPPAKVEGGTNYAYPELTKPLQDITKKNVRFKWGDMEENSFEELKICLSSDRVVVSFDTTLPTRLYVDSSYAGTQATVA